MAFDGAFLYAVKMEMQFLIGSRVDKIHQPSREEIIITLRSRNGGHKLLISASANSARIHITESSIDNPKTPPMFCMLLRKHLGGGKLVTIRQTGLERILFLDFECVNELGDIVTVTLACEVMGKYSNIIMIDNKGNVIDSIKRVDEDMSRERLILPGIGYEMPPRTDRVSFIDADSEQIRQAIVNAPDIELSKAIIKAFEGVSPILAREWAFYAAKGNEVTVSEMSEEMLQRLVFTIDRTKQSMMNMDNCYTVVKTKEGMLKDFSLVRINQYGNLMLTIEKSSVFETLDYFYSQRDSVSRLKQRANDLFKLLVNTSERITKRLANQREELELGKEKDKYKLYGDLVSANIYRLEKGIKSITVENFYDENLPEIEIKLDERLSPSQNAQKYYAEYRKLITAESKLAEQIVYGEDELKYIDSVFDALTRAVSEDEIMELRTELAQQKYIRLGKVRGKAGKPLPPIEFESSDGYRILVGRNNVQNDKLSMKTAEKTDIWLHTHDITGSHVIIQTNGNEPPYRTIEEAAVIAAWHSRARESSQVPVDYTLVKFVKKPNGAKPGMVIFTNNKTLYMTPDEEIVERLRVK